MKGSPRSLMLTWANTVAGRWTSAAVSAMQRQQREMIAAALGVMKPSPTRKTRKSRRRRKPRGV